MINFAYPVNSSAGVASQSAGTQDWNFVSADMNLTANDPVQQPKQCSTGTQEQPEEDLGFGTHIKEAVGILKDWVGK